MPGQIARGSKAMPVAIMDDDGNYLGSAANPINVSGAGGGGGGGAVTIADGADIAEGATTATAYTDRTGAAAGTVVSLLKGLFANGITGNVATATADSGNPIKIGGVFNTSFPALTAGQRGDLQVNPTGALNVATILQTAAADGLNNATYGLLVRRDSNSGGALGVYASVFNGTSWDRQRGDTNGTFTVSKGSGTIATAQASVGTTSTQIVAARANRGAVTITNLGTTDIFIGVTGVTATTGTLLLGSKGASITIPTNAAVFGVAATAQTVSVLEVF